MVDRNVDLAELEMAFAKDPASDAFLALSAAYLEQGRFMEAMVVCKKGIKSQPTNIEGKLLLARVYAGQGKLPKAMEEVNGALSQAPDHADAYFLLGQLHERSGRFEEAIESFQDAVAKDASHEGAIAALKEKGIDVAPPAPPPPPPQPEREPERVPVFHLPPGTGTHPATTSDIPDGNASAPASPVSSSTESVHTASTGPSAPASLPAAGGYDAPSGSGRQAVSMPPQYASAYAMQSAFAGGYDPLAEHQARSKKFGLGFTFGLAVLLLVTVGGLIVFLRANKAEKEEIAAYIKVGQGESAKGTTSGLRQALASFEDVLKIDDDQETATAYLAYTYAVLVYERGLRDLEAKGKAAIAKAEKEIPGHPAVVAARMIQRLSSGQAAQAVEIHQAFLADQENGAKAPPLVNIVLARAYRTLGKLNEMQALLEEMRKGTTDPSQLTWLGVLYRALGDRIRAREAFELALKTEADHDPARAQRALLLLEVKDLSNLPVALDDVTRLQDLGKGNLGTKQYGYAALARGEIQRLSGRDVESERDFKTAQDELGRDADVIFFQAKALAESNKLGDAVTKYQEATRADPYRLRPWDQLIRVAAEANKVDDAEAAVAEARKIFPDVIDISLGEVFVLARKRKFEEAQTMLEALLQKKDDAEARAELGRVLLYRGKDAEAIEALRLAAEKSASKPSLTRAYIYTLLGRALAKSNDHDNAIEAYGQAVSTSSKYAEAYYWLGISLTEARRTSTAREAFSEVLKLDPKGERAQSAQSRLDALR